MGYRNRDEYDDDFGGEDDDRARRRRDGCTSGVIAIVALLGAFLVMFVVELSKR